MKNQIGQFIGFSNPRYTQVPDELFDELLADLTGSELKVLLYVVRRTFGFKRDSDHISLSQMTDGIQKKDGTILDKGTGLDKKTVIRAVKSLVSKGILIHTRKSSPEKGYESSEYALHIVSSPSWHNATRPDVGKKPQALVAKRHIQKTVTQETSKTFRNVKKKPEKRTTVDNFIREKREYLVGQILEVCKDQHSTAFYRKVVGLLPEGVIHEALSQVREAEQLGRIRERPGAMFTDLIIRKAKELGVDLGIENKELSTESNPISKEHEALSETKEESLNIHTPAELMIEGRISRR